MNRIFVDRWVAQLGSIRNVGSNSRALHGATSLSRTAGSGLAKIMSFIATLYCAAFEAADQIRELRTSRQSCGVPWSSVSLADQQQTLLKISKTNGFIYETGSPFFCNPSCCLRTKQSLLFSYQSTTWCAAFAVFWPLVALRFQKKMDRIFQRPGTTTTVIPWLVNSKLC